MATRKTRVRNEDVTPSVQTDAFDANPEARFVSIETGFGLKSTPIYTAALDLRTGVYTDQTGMLNLEDLLYGVDIDDDDERAGMTVVMENCGDSQARVVACVRVIERQRGDNRPLPVDDLFDLNLGAGCIEVSRYIARLDDPVHQQRAVREMLRSTIAHIRKMGVDDHVYAIVEPPLERVLRILGVGITRIADPLWVAEYQGVNVAVKLDPVVSAASLGGLAEIEALDVSEGAVRFWGEAVR